ncbi:MAG: choice-of-anchor D domain-containing protein [Rubripirellula sp.]
MTVPDIQLTDTEFDSRAGKLSATTDDFKAGEELDKKRNLAVLEMDLAAIAGLLVGFPILGEVSLNLGPLEAVATLFSYKLVETLAVNQSVEVEPRVDSESAKFEFRDPVTLLPVAVNVKVVRGGSVVDLVGVTEASFLPGSRIDITTPVGQAVEVVPSLKIENRFHNDIGFDLDFSGKLKALELKLTLDTPIKPVKETFGPVVPEFKHTIAKGDLGALFDETFDLPTKPTTGVRVTPPINTPGFAITESNGATLATTAGQTDSFSVVLSAPPTANVLLAVSSRHASRTSVDTASLTFTPQNWNTPQSVMVTALSATPITVIDVSVSSSLDLNFAGLAAQQVYVEASPKLTPFTIGGGMSQMVMDGRSPGSAIMLNDSVATTGNPNADGSIVPFVANVPYFFNVPVVRDGASFDFVDISAPSGVTNVVVAERGLVLEGLTSGGAPFEIPLVPNQRYRFPDGSNFTAFRISNIKNTSVGGAAQNRMLIGITPALSGSAITATLPSVDDESTDRISEGNGATGPSDNLMQIQFALVSNDQGLDIDGDGTISPLTDGILVSRFLSGARGTELTAGAVGMDSEFADAASIEPRIQRLLDEAGGGRLGLIANDPVMLMRHLAGFADLDMDGNDDDAANDRLTGTRTLNIVPAVIDSEGFDPAVVGSQTESGQQVQTAVGSTSENPIVAVQNNGVFSVELTAFNEAVQYIDKFLADADDPTKNTILSTGVFGGTQRYRTTDSNVGPEDDQSFEQAVIFNQRISTVTRTARLGSQEPLFVSIPDAAGYDFEAPSGFLFTHLDFDSLAGDNASYDHSNVGDQTEVDFDVHLPATDEWFVLTINPGDQPIPFPGDGVNRFELFPRTLSAESQSNVPLNEVPDLNLIIGLVLSGLSDSPVIEITKLGDRKPLFDPEVVKVDSTDGSTENEFRLARDGANLAVTKNGSPVTLVGSPDLTAPYPASSIGSFAIQGSPFANETLVLDQTMGQFDIPILFSGHFAFEDRSEDERRVPISFDTLKVEGSGVTVDLIDDVELESVVVIDIRGAGVNTLILDEAAILENTFEIHVFADRSGPDADIIDMSASNFTKSDETYEQVFDGVTFLFDEFVSRFGAFLYIIQDPDGASSDALILDPAKTIRQTTASDSRSQTTAASLGFSTRPKVPAEGLDTQTPTQVVALTVDKDQVAFGETVSVNIDYSLAGDVVDLPNGLAIQVHYNGSLLRFDSVENLSTGFEGSMDRSEGVADGIAGTDRMIELIWYEEAGGWLTLTETPVSLATLEFTALQEVGTAPISITRTLNPLFEYQTAAESVVVQPATFLVDTAVDENDANFAVGDLSLREAIALSNDAVGLAIILFDPDLFGSTITLNDGPLSITDTTVIVGPGAQRLTIDGNDASGVFDVDAETVISGLTITGGLAASGGAIQLDGILQLRSVALIGNHSTGVGGAISVGLTSSLTIDGSEVSGNSSDGDGGGIHSLGLLLISGSTIGENTSLTNGGGIANGTKQIGITSSTIAMNRADGDGNGGTGGGIHSETANVLLFNTIVAGNVGGTGTTASDVGGTLDVGSSFNLIADPSTAGGLIHGTSGNVLGDGSGVAIDAGTIIATSLAGNGGSTGSYLPVDNSPALEAGLNANALRASGLVLENDQRGFSRFVNGTADIGAIEVGPVPGFEVTPSGSLTVTESGMSDEIQVRLLAPPAATVALILSSSDTGESVPRFTQIMFTPENWQEPQMVPMDGVDDQLSDGTQQSVLTISIDPTISDQSFLSLPDQTINVITIDDETTGAGVNVQGNGVSIADGDSTPSATDQTDFGTANVATGSVTRTFMISNFGSVGLDLTGDPLVQVDGIDAIDFTVTAMPTTPVSGNGGTTTFDVTFDPSVSGVRTAIISFANSDSDVNPFSFTIVGTGSTGAIVPLTSTSSTIDIESGDVVVRSSGVVLFRAPTDSLPELRIDGTSGDDTVQVGLSSLSDSGLLVLNGGLGTNTLLVDVAALDLANTDAVVAENFALVSLLASGQNVLTLDADTVSALSSGDEVITVQGDSAVDRFIFTDVVEWRLETPQSDGEFVLVAVNQVTGQTVRARMSSGWHNILVPSDVNNNGGVTANDALVIINELGRRAFSTSPSGVLDDPLTAVPFPSTYYDQNGDGKVTAIDALRVVNQLARLNNSGGSEQVEGEQSIAQALPLQTSDMGSRSDRLKDLEFNSASVAEIHGKPLVALPTVNSQTTSPQQSIDEAEDERADSWADQVDQCLAEMGIETQIG